LFNEQRGTEAGRHQSAAAQALTSPVVVFQSWINRSCSLPCTDSYFFLFL